MENTTTTEAVGTKSIVYLSSLALHILQHSLGLDKYGDGNSYRNRFITPCDGPDGLLCKVLVEAGLMKDHGPQKIADGMHCYSVTPAGIDAVAFNSPVRPKVSRSKRRYQEYLNSDSGRSFAEWIGAKK